MSQWQGRGWRTALWNAEQTQAISRAHTVDVGAIRAICQMFWFPVSEKKIDVSIHPLLTRRSHTTSSGQSVPKRKNIQHFWTHLPAMMKTSRVSLYATTISWWRPASGPEQQTENNVGLIIDLQEHEIHQRKKPFILVPWDMELSCYLPMLTERNPPSLNPFLDLMDN